MKVIMEVTGAKTEVMTVVIKEVVAEMEVVTKMNIIKKKQIT